MKRICLLSLILAAVCLSGCVTRVVYAPPPPPPGAPPAPAVVAYTPDYYVWDGYEYVGVCGDHYVYYNAGAWLVCDAVILGRFHGWERYHADWRRGAVHYHRGHELHR